MKMKSSKRFLSLALCLIMCLGLCVPALAAETVNVAFTVAADKSSVAPGESVTVTLTLNSADALAAGVLQFAASDGTNSLSISSIEIADTIPGSRNETSGKISFGNKNGSGAENLPAGTLIATVTFATNASTPTGTYTVSVTVPSGEGLYRADNVRLTPIFGTAVSIEVTNGSLMTEIRTEQELRAFAASVNAGTDYSGHSVSLMNDITLSSQWVPIGNYEHPFSGIFDGAGYTIANAELVAAGTESDGFYTGLFGIVKDAQIKNLSVSGSANVEAMYAGGIVAYATGSSVIENCRNAISITDTMAMSCCVGGIAGSAVTVIGCRNDGDISGERAQAAGGIIGECDGTVRNCANYGTVSGGVSGGIVGKGAPTITACTNKGNVTAYNVGGGYAAGILGYIPDGRYVYATITSCYNIGAISGATGGTKQSQEPVVAGILARWNIMYQVQTREKVAVIHNSWNSGTLKKIDDPATDETGCGEIYPGKMYKNGYPDSVVITPVAWFDVEGCYGATDVLSADKLNEMMPGTWKTASDGTTILLYWESEEYSDAECEVEFTVTPSAASPVITVFSDEDMTDEVGTGASYSLTGGMYYYSIRAKGYYPESGSFVVDGMPVSIAKTLSPAATVTVNVTDADGAALSGASVSVEGGGREAMALSADGGSYVFLLSPGEIYTVSVTADGYNGASQGITAADGEMVSIILTASERPTTEIWGSENTGKPYQITEGGSYALAEGAKGTVEISTASPVTIVGKGVTSSDAYTEVTLRGTVAGIDLTVQDLYILNSGSDGGEGIHAIDLQGTGNKLHVAGTSLIESTVYTSSAVIHVPKGAEVTLDGDGTLYMYKYTQGSGIGGSADEACGQITFAGGTYFIKGSKTGAIIGGDATDGMVNDDITISGGKLNIIAVAQGAAIGSSRMGTCAGNVYLTGGNVTITTDYTGSAIGYGGNQAGSPGKLIVTGGSLKTYVTENAAASWGLSEAAISDVNITAEKTDADGDPVYRLVFDASAYTAGEITATVDGTQMYQGSLHEKECLNPKESTTTIANWSDSSDTNLYLYLTGKDHTLSVTDGITTKTYNVTWTGSEFIYSEAGVTSYTVTFTGEHGAKALVNGTAQSAASVAEGDSLTFGTTAETGYEVTAAALAGNTGTLTKNSDGTWTLSSVTADTEVILTAGPRAYAVEFSVTPTNATVLVIDSKGNTVTGTNNIFSLLYGETYTYTVSAEGYTSRNGELTPGENFTEDQTGGNAIQVKLSKSSEAEGEEYTVVFKPTPEDANIVVKDAKGNLIAGENGSFQLKAGSYSYSVLRDGYETRSATLEVTGDATVEITLIRLYTVVFDLTPATAAVTVKDAAGKEVAGEGRSYQLRDGQKYTYTVSADGYQSRSGDFVANEDRTISVALLKEETADKTYKVTFQTTPEDAKLAVTDASGSAVAGEDKVFELKDGETYTYTVSAEGYKTHTSTLTPGVEFTEDHTVTVTLAKEATDKTYKVTFLTTPADATVTVVDASGSPVAGDGKVFELKDGETYTYTVSAEGYESLSADVIPGLDFTEDCTYTVELPKKAKTYKVEFKLSPESATIKVCDEIGELVGENNIYQLEEGVTYTYTVSAEGYKTKSGDLIPGVDFDSDQVGENAIEISLSKDESNSASENTSSIWDGESIDASWEGDGSEENPYKISSAAELAGLAARVNAVGPGNTAFRNTWFKLTKDIDLDNYEWTSIGGGEAQCGFGGHFDGGGHVVSGLYIRSTVSWTEYGGRNRGLFGIIDAGGVVENLGVDGYVYAQRSVGGIAGKNSGTIRRCYNAADIYATDSKGVGGICGANWNQGTITDCYNVGSVTSYYASGSAGGIAGENEYRIERCYNIGDVTSPLNAGGIVGSDKHTGGGASAGAVGTGVCYDCYYLEGTVVGAYTGGIGFEAEDARNTVTAVSAEELKELPKGLGSAFTKDTERLNGGYPILRWQSVSAEGSEEEDEIIVWIEPGGVILGVETDEYGNADAKLREKDAKEGLKVSENKEQLTVEVLSEDAHRIVLDVEHYGMTAIAEADVSLRIVTGRGTITLDKDTVDALIESGYEVRFVVEAKQDGRTRLFITVDHRLSDVMMKVEIPGAEDGQVLVTVNSDGVEEIVKKSVVEGGKAYADLPSGTTVKLVNNQKQFEDVGPKDWFKSAVDFVSSHELFQGTGNGLFEPNSQMTRAMMVTVLYRLEGEPEITEKKAFNDVPDGQWYTDAVAWASGTGIVQGYGEGLFGTNDPITREQMAVILYHYVTWLGLDTSSVEGDLSGFTDGDAVSDWAVEAMRWAVGVGLFQGDDTGALEPGDTATRAEVATLYERLVRMLVM